MSKAAATALKKSLDANNELPYNAVIEVTFRDATNSLGAYAEIWDTLLDEEENEVYEALVKIIPKTFTYEGVVWDVDNEGLSA